MGERNGGVGEGARRTPGDEAIRTSNEMTAAIGNMVSLNLNNSNLNYDSYSSAQDLADLSLNGPPLMYEDVSRSRVLSELTVVHGSMTLQQRMRLSNALAGIEMEPTCRSTKCRSSCSPCRSCYRRKPPT